MISILDQVSRGAIVCPKTKMALKLEGGYLLAEDGTRYEMTGNGVPILLEDAARAQRYSQDSGRMNKEYTPSSIRKRKSLLGKLKQALNKDYRTKASRDAFHSVIGVMPANALCLSVGGGPLRIDERLVNLNIGPFPNVDVVADAHQLPYADDSVDSIYCEAVLEHLADPSEAVGEMFRVLRPGGKLIAITPFMQGFHGYPNHFQKFTQIGHALLFSKAGFKVVESGTCVGPVFAVSTIFLVFIQEYLPRPIRFPLKLAWKVLAVALTPIDRVLGSSPAGHVLASSTYVVAEKIRG